MLAAEKDYSSLSRDLRVGLGHWLKSLREDQGLTQRDLADRLGLEYYTFISQLETGRGKIPPNRYLDWAKALGQDPRAFVTRLFSCYDPITHEIIMGNDSL
ncbi:MAG: helix-turn-helix transcriptional regulator [Aestuariivita sp.]|nr:helix-turn-helix transcriptional regulator [Aestuariivita sp.]MCY4201594.1 helix-turn-helix transcriptional regulator [Aestuariivita sp.]MCY4287989.1 helix-turn-helix transcriptional regulator [Aestuariivita sp.]MCY4347582.1 helix-turn-helix transcriptional regulator [Aestuariivita sp.]